MKKKKKICNNDDGLSSQFVADADNSADEIVVRSSTNETHLLDIPLHLLQKFCVGVEYLNFRATCKLCRLAIPVPNTLPWLMVFGDYGITFTNPMSGGMYRNEVSSKFYIKYRRTDHYYGYYGGLSYYGYGWLLLFMDDLVFFNPFTLDTIKLPQVPCSGYKYCFSAPPTSNDCMVIGFPFSDSFDAYIHFVGREPSWRKCHLELGDPTYSIGSPTFCGRHFYASFNNGALKLYYKIRDNNYLVKCDQHILKVSVKYFDDAIQVFKMNEDGKWEKIDNLGRHVIFLSEGICICMDAKRPEMENKIFFPRLHHDTGKIIFYSLETCCYHTFNGGIVERNFDELSRASYIDDTHAWIEPSWSYLSN